MYESWVTSPLHTESRTWGARTWTHSYALDVDVEPLACETPARWRLLEFETPGPLDAFNLTAETCRVARLMGYRIAACSVREITADEFTELALERQAVGSL